MFKVGLTGGIASGKTTISLIFKNLGVPVYDTDKISHQLMQLDAPAYVKAVEHFGKEILNTDLTINRPLLRQKVFQQPEQKIWLEKMIHPMIMERSREVLQQQHSSRYVLLVVPLMFETKFDQLVDYVIAIDCPVSVQITRLMQRDGIDRPLALQMISSQITNEKRLELSDASIKNDGGFEYLEAAIESLHHALLKLAKQHEDK